MTYNNYNTKMIGLIDGPGKIKSHDPVKLDNYWTIINIPSDIPIETAKFHVHNFLSKIVSIVLPTSYMCNLRCDYCYIRQTWRKNHVVSDETILNLGKLGIDNIINYNNTNSKENTISLWGAEPFCNLNILEKVIDLCLNNNCKISTSTNGTIVNEKSIYLLNKMYSNNIIDRIQISLDGPKHIHDKHRKDINGEGSFDSIMKFIEILHNISVNLNVYIKYGRIYHFTGTCTLDKETPQNFLEITKFFTDRNNELIYDECVPSRMENSLSYTKDNCTQFVKTFEDFYKYICTVNYPIIDYYTSKLFLETCRVDGLPRCSAMRTSLALDEDGSLVMCHHPLDNTNNKLIMTFGNLIDGYIDYKSLISNIDYFNADYLHSAICENCSLTDSDITGSICSNCPPNNFLINNNHVKYDHYKCKAYRETLPIFRKIFERYTLMKRIEEKC